MVAQYRPNGAVEYPPKGAWPISTSALGCVHKDACAPPRNDEHFGQGESNEMPHTSGHTMHHGIDGSMRSCIQECTNCHGICVETITHCLEMGGKHAEAAHIRLLLDCAEICQTSANFI